MKFVDRIEEQKRLHKCLHEAEGTSLSVIYGDVGWASLR